MKEKQPTKQKSAKNKQISIKTSSGTSNPQALKNAPPQKTSPNSRDNRKVGNTDCLWSE